MRAGDKVRLSRSLIKRVCKGTSGLHNSWIAHCLMIKDVKGEVRNISNMSICVMWAGNKGINYYDENQLELVS